MGGGVALVDVGVATAPLVEIQAKGRLRPPPAAPVVAPAQSSELHTVAH